MQYLESKNHLAVNPAWIDLGIELKCYQTWNHDCMFEVDFKRTNLPLLSFPESWIVPYEVVVSGLLGKSASIESVFDVAASSSSALGEFGVFFFGTYFERKDKSQNFKDSSSVLLTRSSEDVSIEFTYRGSQGGDIEGIALEAKKIMLGSGLMDDDDIDLSWWSVTGKLAKIDHAAAKLLVQLVGSLGSGRVFEHHWDASIMGVDPENVNKHGFELYNRVAESGLTADKIQANFKLQFLDMRGLGVVRQLCQGKTNYMIPLGTFRHRKKKAILGVFTNKDGHRLSLTMKDTPTEEEWQHLENTLATTFERKPFA